MVHLSRQGSGAEWAAKGQLDAHRYCLPLRRRLHAYLAAGSALYVSLQACSSVWEHPHQHLLDSSLQRSYGA